MNKKKKVLHLVEAMGGGVFTYLAELANGMSDEFDVSIAFGLSLIHISEPTRP